MAVATVVARYRELDGRDSMARASMWQGNAGTLYGNNVVYADPGLAIALTASKVKTTASAQYTIGGGIYTKAATDNFWTLGSATSATTVPTGGFQKYALLVDDTGAATVQEATFNSVSLATVSWANVAAAAKANPANPWAPLCTMLNNSACIFGILSVTNASGANFVPGTTLLSAAGITTAFRASIEPQLNPVLANERGLIVGISI